MDITKTPDGVRLIDRHGTRWNLFDGSAGMEIRVVASSDPAILTDVMSIRPMSANTIRITLEKANG